MRPSRCELLIHECRPTIVQHTQPPRFSPKTSGHATNFEFIPRRHTMTIVKPWITAITMAFVASQLFADPKPAAPDDDPSRLAKDAAQIHKSVKELLPGELKWQEIPWMLDLKEGIRLAKEEKRPLLLWVSGDDPLEKC